jgi:hypothetical protein
MPRHIEQRCKTLGRHVPWATEVCTVAPSTCGSSVWNLLYVTTGGPRILRWFLDVWYICAPCTKMSVLRSVCQIRMRHRTHISGYYVLLTVHLSIILVNYQLDAQFFFHIFISILYMFRATSCSSSGESIVWTQHLLYVTLCRWPPSMQVGKFLPDLHTRRSPTQSDIQQMLYSYNWFSWWWARGWSKHVENWNKYIENRNCALSW